MLFHTWIFAVFFAITYSVFLAIRNTRVWPHWLLLASYVFYGWWNPLYLLLILYSTALDYVVGLRLMKSARRKTWLAFSIVNGLFLLGFFKYGSFVAENVNVLLAWLGLPLTVPKADILLPVGISFYTFQSMSYAIDVYRRQIDAERNFVRFALYVAFFSQLVAGPIERATHLLPQIRAMRAVRPENIATGLSFVVAGLFKKMALADFLSLYVDSVYRAPMQFDSLSLILATYAFAWQIYFDFSGYSDMARGLAKMMGFDLVVNFRNPYLATSLGDFWRRWHISLSTWFRDYVYIPMGGNRKGVPRTYLNVFLTMLICGVWHGANWTFVVWGLLHAAGQAVTRRWEAAPFYERIPRIVRQALVFHFVCLGWVFFRAGSLEQALLILKRIVSTPLHDPRFPIVALALCAAVWLHQWISESRLSGVLQLRVVRMGAVLFALLYLIFFARSGNAPFIYFQF